MANKPRYSDEERKERRKETFRKMNQKRKQYSVTYGLAEEKEVSAIELYLKEKNISGSNFIKNLISEHLKKNGYL